MFFHIIPPQNNIKKLNLKSISIISVFRFIYAIAFIDNMAIGLNTLSVTYLSSMRKFNRGVFLIHMNLIDSVLVRVIFTNKTDPCSENHNDHSLDHHIFDIGF